MTDQELNKKIEQTGQVILNEVTTCYNNLVLLILGIWGATILGVIAIILLSKN